MLRKSSSSWKVYKRNWQKAKQPHLQTFHEKEIEEEAGEEMHDERKQSCLSKGLPYQKCVFTSRTRQQRQQRIFDFTPLANSFRLFFIQSSQEWLLYESLSTPTYTEAYHEVRLLSTKATTTQRREKRQRKKNIMIKTFLLLSSSPLLLLTRLCRRVSVSLRLSLWRMKISRHDTYTTPYYV